ncbi:MAG: hypothetical protein ACRCXY_10655 [Fusobacteriaceae bacterium]
MKKIYFIFTFMLLFLFVGCTPTVIQTRTQVVQPSKVISARVERIVGREVYLELQNKSNSIVELKLTESTLNDGKILDVNKMSTNDYANNNNYNYNNDYNYNYSKHDKKHKDDKNRDYYVPAPIIVEARTPINEDINDIILNPREILTIKVGSRNLNLPMKIILKYVVNNKVGFVSVYVEGIYIENN